MLADKPASAGNEGVAALGSGGTCAYFSFRFDNSHLKFLRQSS
jgi:hypothetical protein